MYFKYIRGGHFLKKCSHNPLLLKIKDSLRSEWSHLIILHKSFFFFKLLFVQNGILWSINQTLVHPISFLFHRLGFLFFPLLKQWRGNRREEENKLEACKPHCKLPCLWAKTWNRVLNHLDTLFKFFFLLALDRYEVKQDFHFVFWLVSSDMNHNKQEKWALVLDQGIWGRLII